MKVIIKSLVTTVTMVIAWPALADYANDRAEIVNLSNKYMVAVDAGDIDTVMTTWHEDGRLVWVFGDEQGKEEVFRAMSGFGGARYQEIAEDAAKRPRTRHQIINHVIDIDGNTANTTAYWFAMTNNNPHGEVRLLYMGHYKDILVKEDGRWLFKERRVYNESFDNSALWYPELGEVDPRTRRPPE
jgi:hypothetical protein